MIQSIIDYVRPADQQSSTFVKMRLMARIQELMESADKRLTTAQGQYKRYHDRKVRVLPIFSAGQYVFVDRAPDAATNESYNKLLPKSFGPFEVLDSTPETVTIREDGLRNTVSLDRVTLVPDSRVIVREDAHATKKDADISPSNNAANAPQESVEPEQPKEFVIDRIVGHEDHDDGRLYRFRWYGYTDKHDMLESAHHLPTNFVVRYERRLKASPTAGTASSKKGRGTRKRSYTTQ